MFNNSNNQTEKIDYKFIVVYDSFTEPIAQSLSNRAVEKNITSTTWDENEYKHNKASITNFNYLVILSKKIINKNWADPILKQNEIIQGVLYKKQGHQIGLYIDKNVNVIKTADLLGQLFKEDWGKFVLALVAGGLVGSAILGALLRTLKIKRAKFYLQWKAIDEFDKKLMLDFVQDKLKA